MIQDKPIRRSQLISPWGVGSICNFPNDESLMVCGLDAWENEFSTLDGPEEFKIIEERLQQRLGVSHFRQPPDFRRPSPSITNPSKKIPFIRFPRWHYCPKCGSMAKLSLYGGRQSCDGFNFSNGMSCHTTNRNRRPFLIPSRFIAVCRKGHIEDFPFLKWVHGNDSFKSSCKLRLRAGRSASTLSGIFIECVTCNKRKSMAGSFNDDSLNNVGITCNGERPWLGQFGTNTNGCTHHLKVTQRGASNVYFPKIISSIYLPRWDKTTSRLIEGVLEQNWGFLTSGVINGELDSQRFELIAEQRNLDKEDLIEAAKLRLAIEDGYSIEDPQGELDEEYRKTEYDAILSGLGSDSQDFYVHVHNSNNYSEQVSNNFSNICLLHKLRETRALVGFSRILPDSGSTIQELKSEMRLSETLDWLPAITVKGEGIFFEFGREKIHDWAQKEEVIERFNYLKENFDRSRINRGLSTLEINPRFVLIHTFAHLIINELSFVCGYGSSSIRERIYCNRENISEEGSMDGVLIYTASGDSEGSLGGLVRQGKAGSLEEIVNSAIVSAEWCSADPICIDSHGQGPDSCNLSACHNCAVLPETCCEEGNRLLDRGLIVGTIDYPVIGYFS